MAVLPNIFMGECIMYRILIAVVACVGLCASVYTTPRYDDTLALLCMGESSNNSLWKDFRTQRHFLVKECKVATPTLIDRSCLSSLQKVLEQTQQYKKRCVYAQGGDARCIVPFFARNKPAVNALIVDAITLPAYFCETHTLFEELDSLPNNTAIIILSPDERQMRGSRALYYRLKQLNKPVYLLEQGAKKQTSLLRLLQRLSLLPNESAVRVLDAYQPDIALYRDDYQHLVHDIKVITTLIHVGVILYILCVCYVGGDSMKPLYFS